MEVDLRDLLKNTNPMVRRAIRRLLGCLLAGLITSFTWWLEDVIFPGLQDFLGYDVWSRFYGVYIIGWVAGLDILSKKLRSGKHPIFLPF